MYKKIKDPKTLRDSIKQDTHDHRPKRKERRLQVEQAKIYNHRANAHVLDAGVVALMAVRCWGYMRPMSLIYPPAYCIDFPASLAIFESCVGFPCAGTHRWVESFIEEIQDLFLKVVISANSWGKSGKEFTYLSFPESRKCGYTRWGILRREVGMLLSLLYLSFMPINLWWSASNWDFD